MKRLSCSFWNFALMSLIFMATPMRAQQSLFNVPASEITEKNTIFFQEQINMTNAMISNTNFCYGLGGDMEVGMNFIGLQTDFGKIYTNDNFRQGSVSPTTMVTFQKLFPISNHTNLAMGEEIGTNLFKSTTSDMTIANFTYVNTHSRLWEDKLKLIGGLYYANSSYAGSGSNLGIMAGYELTVTNKIHLMGDWLVGDNYIGVGVIGGVYYLTKEILLSLGIQVPNNRNKNDYGAVFEFTYLPIKK